MSYKFEEKGIKSRAWYVAAFKFRGKEKPGINFLTSFKGVSWTAAREAVNELVASGYLKDVTKFGNKQEKYEVTSFGHRCIAESVDHWGPLDFVLGKNDTPAAEPKDTTPIRIQTRDESPRNPMDTAAPGIGKKHSVGEDAPGLIHPLPGSAEAETHRMTHIHESTPRSDESFGEELARGGVLPPLEIALEHDEPETVIPLKGVHRIVDTAVTLGQEIEKEKANDRALNPDWCLNCKKPATARCEEDMHLRTDDPEKYFRDLIGSEIKNEMAELPQITISAAPPELVLVKDLKRSLGDYLVDKYADHVTVKDLIRYLETK